MTRKELRAALGSMVEEHGFRMVSRLLRELGPEEDRPPRSEKRARKPRPERPPRPTGALGGTSARPRPSALDYVRRLDLEPHRTPVMERAAEAFERREFLPTASDIRRLCETYGIEAPRASSRRGAIPRIFRFLGTMDPAEVERILDEGLFTGPARLGPIADAIRRRGKELRAAANPRG